ncbi:MAG: methyltransferase domain-containing protein [Desulfobacteraceae bacterium]|nr:methyltransferase domain-containing protein [Desulfobacteraceae bacterium]
MRIVFVDPGFGKRSWNTFGQSHWTSIIHQGLCGLSSSCKKAGYQDIHLLDIRMMKNWNDLEYRFRELNPDVVGLSMRSCDMNMVAEIANRFKNINQDVKIVVGGIHVSIDPEFVQRNNNYDYIIAGEGEVSFVEFIQALEKGEGYPRFCWGKRPNLDNLPFIDREIYPYKKVIGLPNYEGIFKAPMVTMLCSRGCLYNCSFCAPHSRIHFGKGVRIRSVQSVVEELRILYDKYQFNCVKFYDYTFTQYPKWVEEFCDLYASISKPFWIQSRADLICRRADLIRKLKRVGLKLIGIGFESGSNRVLKFLRKGTTRDINLEASQIVKSNGVFLSASFMLGIPEEEEEDIKDTISLAREMKPHFTSIAFFTPIPGNDLYTYCKDKDLILNEDPEMWVEFSPEIPKIKGKDYEQLKKAAAEIMGDRFGGRLIGKIIRYLYVKTKYHYRLRNFLVYCYSKWVSSCGHRLIQRCVGSPRKNIGNSKKNDEVQRIKNAYSKRKSKASSAYSHLLCQQREKEIKETIRRSKFISLNDKKILDVGCGNGSILSCFLKDGVLLQNLYGIDLLPERIKEAKKLYPGMHFTCGNAEKLPYPDEFFDIITQATVFTSILEPGMKKKVASEMVRVLKPNGVIIWYDYRFDNPFNPDVRGVRKREIMDLFPNCQFDFKLTTLNPFIARPLAKLSGRLCKALESLSVLRTHWLVTIKKYMRH